MDRLDQDEHLVVGEPFAVVFAAPLPDPVAAEADRAIKLAGIGHLDSVAQRLLDQTHFLGDGSNGLAHP